jgi:uncharacterized membrane protein YdjX (TVP38/TMEM64 family)
MQNQPLIHHGQGSFSSSTNPDFVNDNATMRT